MPFDTIQAVVDDAGIATLSLARPDRLNALSVAMRREISACLAAWAEDPAVGAVIVTGQGRAFCAGYDVDEFRLPERGADILASSTAYHRDVWYFPKPTICAVNGLAVGGGFDLAVLCDLRLCAEEAYFAHPELRHGAPPLFTPLRWVVGDAVARDLCLTRRRLPAEEALRLGLVRQVVPASTLASSARALAALILEAPADALRFTKQRFTESGGLDFDRCLAEEHDRAFRELILRPERWR